jgi:hypothetical protein
MSVRWPAIGANTQWSQSGDTGSSHIIVKGFTADSYFAALSFLCKRRTAKNSKLFHFYNSQNEFIQKYSYETIFLVDFHRYW